MNLHDLLDEAADTALSGRPGVDVDAVMTRARVHVRAHRARRAATSLLAAAAVVAVVLGLQFGGGSLRGGAVARPAAGPARVPAVLYLPPVWTPSVAQQPIARAAYAVSAWPMAAPESLPYAPATVPVLVSADGGEYRALPWRSGDHELVLSPDGTRAAWSRDGGMGAAGEQVVVLQVATGRTTSLALPSTGGQGADVRSLAFAPDSRGLAVAVTEPVGEVRSRVLFRTLPEGSWQQVCACEGPLGWSDAGDLLVGAGFAYGTVATASGRVAVRATGEASSYSGAPVDAAPTGSRVSAADHPLLLVSTSSGGLTLRSADGRIRADLAGLDPAATGGRAGAADEAEHWELVVGGGQQSVFVARGIGAPGAVPRASVVQQVTLSAGGGVLPVRTITRVERGLAVVVAAAGDVLERADVETVPAAAPGKGDVDWWRYQVHRIGTATWHLVTQLWWLWAAVLFLAASVWWRRSRAAGMGRRPSGAPRLALMGRWSDGRRTSSRGRVARGLTGPVAPRRGPLRRFAIPVASVLVLSLGAFLLLASSLAEREQREADQQRSPVAVVVPATLDDWGSPRPVRLGAADAPRRLSMLVSDEARSLSGPFGVDAATGRLVSLAGLGSGEGDPGLHGSFDPTAISPGGTVIAQATYDRRQVTVIDLAQGTVEHYPIDVGIGADEGGQGRLTDALAVSDDATVLVITGKQALWKLGRGGVATEFKRFGAVAGVAAQPSGRFLIWRHFGDETGPPRLDLIDPASGAVKNWLTWSQIGPLHPVAAEGPDRSLILRTLDGRVVLHEVGGLETDLGRMPQADWFGATGDGAVVTVVAPEDRLAVGAAVSVAAWTAVPGSSRRPDAEDATAVSDRAGAGLASVGLSAARLALAPAVLGQASPVATGEAEGWFMWAQREGAAGVVGPLGLWLVVAGVVGLVLALVGGLRRRRRV